MNKLQEAGNKVRERILILADSEGRFDYGALDMIEETVREVCSEYARSKIPNKPSRWDKIQSMGFNACRDTVLLSIDQDLQSLNN